MLTSIRDTQAEMLKQFAGNGTITVPGIATPIPVIYARKSALTYAEMTEERYPVVSVLDYPPDIDTEWMQNFEQTVSGHHDFTDNKSAKAYLIEDPIRLNFRYEITTFLSNPNHKYLTADYMFKRFQSRGQFILNALTVDGDTIGDVVGYTMNHSEVPRTDGIFEMTYEFVAKILVQIKDPIEVDLINNFNIFVRPKLI